MKKVIKKRNFFVIILCIISCGIGVYAATNYKATDIVYNGSDGTSMNVEDALNELYNNSMTKCEKDKFCSKVKLGDYIKMRPIETSYTILSTLTGYSSNQKINPSELNLWRVIKKNDDGTIEMVSEYVSSINVNFQGKTGYLNFTGTLNLIASQYGNSKYIVNSRIMGYNGQTSTITDTSKFTNPASWINSISDNSNETLGGGDIMYENDTNLVKEALGTLLTNNLSGTITAYWLGSRRYNYHSATHYTWNGLFVNTNGGISNGGLYIYYNNSGWVNYSSGYAIRPILTLKSGLSVTGTGTSDDPYVLE